MYKMSTVIVKENTTINLVDVSVNEIFREIAISLRAQSKFVDDQPDDDE